MADYYLDGVFKFKKNLTKREILSLNGYGDFRCVNKTMVGLFGVTENGKVRLYYEEDSTSNRYLVWEEGTGWIKDCYRTITFDYGWVDIDVYEPIIYCTVEYLQTGSDSGSGWYEFYGTQKVHRGTWVFPDVIDYEFPNESIREINVAVRFKDAIGSSHTSMKWNSIGLYFDNTLVYSRTSGWKDLNARMVNFTGDVYGDDYTKDDLQLCGFIIATASENARVEYNGSHIVTFSAGNQVSLECSGKVMTSDVTIYAAPHVGVCQVYYKGNLIKGYDVTGNITNTQKGVKIPLPTKDLYMDENLVIKLTG